MINLGQFLLEQGSKRRIDGVHDCCTFPADWAISQGYVDPMAKWRGTYASEDEALCVIADAGGLVDLFDEGLSSVGISRRESGPLEGDIGIVTAMGNEAGAIFTGKRWALVATRGVAFVSLETSAIAAVWAVGCG